MKGSTGSQLEASQLALRRVHLREGRGDVVVAAALLGDKPEAAPGRRHRQAGHRTGG
jgi:hypothetical protein